MARNQPQKRKIKAKSQISPKFSLRKKTGTHARCTDGLRKSVQKKRAETASRYEQAMQKLLRERKPINFLAVAREARVSVAWLYKEPEVRQRIEHLRAQIQPQKAFVPSCEKISDASLRAQNDALRKRNQELTNDIKKLTERIGVAFGVISSNNLPIPD